MGVQHWETVDYGREIRFNVRANTPTEIVVARLTVFAEHLAAPHVVDIPVAGGRQVELAQRVSVAELALPAFARFHAQWDFIDAANTRYTSDPFPVTYMDNAVPWEWVAASDGGVTVYTAGGDALTAEAALDLAGAALAGARRTLAVSGPPEISIVVYPELSQLAHSLRLHGENVQDWIAAYAIPAYDVALVAAAPGHDLVANLQRDIPHEVTHLVLDEAVGDRVASLPGWLSEGLALTSAPEPDPTLRRVLLEAAGEGGLLPLEALCAPRFTGLSPQHTALAYAQSESVMRYVSGRFGPSQVQALISAYAGGAECETGVRRALGLSLAELETQWHNDLLSQASRAAQDEGSLVPWLIAWLVSLGLALLFVAPQPQRRVTGGRAP